MPRTQSISCFPHDTDGGGDTRKGTTACFKDVIYEVSGKVGKTLITSNIRETRGHALE